ncbi:DeoR family transcriptional regulator [Shouchella clausii]
MELLSSRQKELLERLLVERDYLSLQQIKDMYQLSPRTIRQDLLDIEEWLLEVGSDINMERSRKFGARLLVNDEQEQLILKALHKSRDFMTQAERWKDMQRRLLLEPSVLVNELYECYQISQNTLKNDINRMK